jgi:lysozyme
VQEQAFLHTIRACEGTDGPDGYHTQFGFRRFESFDGHPRTAFPYRDLNGEMLYTSAAGAYQITWPTWVGAIQPVLHLLDFTPESQDRAALFLINRAGALPDIWAGNLRPALDKCSGRWASLPGSKYAQPKRTYQFCTLAFCSAGGTLR